MLHGRDDETARLTATLDAARAGRASSLVVNGGAGVGTSALLADLAARADDALALITAGLESESPLALAALHRLLRPILDHLPALPCPCHKPKRYDKRSEKQTATRSTSSSSPSRHCHCSPKRADTAPVLCIVYGAQWLDTASAEALLFAARRLLAEPVFLLFAARDDGTHTFAPTDVELIRLGPTATR